MLCLLVGMLFSINSIFLIILVKYLCYLFNRFSFLMNFSFLLLAFLATYFHFYLHFIFNFCFYCNFIRQVLTKDSVTVSVDAVVYYRVSNATVSIANVENAHHSTRLLAQTTLRNTMGTRHLHEILSERMTISGTMQVRKVKRRCLFSSCCNFFFCLLFDKFKL